MKKIVTVFLALLYAFAISSVYKVSSAYGFFFSVVSDRSDSWGIHNLFPLIISAYFFYPRNIYTSYSLFSCLIHLLVIFPSIALAIFFGESFDVALVMLFASFTIHSFDSANRNRRICRRHGNLDEAGTLRGFALEPLPKMQCVKEIKFTSLIFTAQVLVSIYIAIYFSSLIAIDADFAVYERREAARALTSYLDGVLISWLTYFLSPLLLIIGLGKKSIKYMMAPFLSFLLVFVVTGAKVVLAMPFFIVIFYIFAKKMNDSKILLSIMILLVLIFTILDFFILNFPIFYPFLIERTLIAPAVLSNTYISYYINNEPAYFGYGLFSSIGLTEYRHEPSLLIGAEFYREESRANANFIAEGFANFRYLGVAVYSITVASLMAGLNKLSANMGRSFSMAISVPYIFYLTNSSPFTMLITGGFFLLGVYLLAQKIVIKR